jgi:hypothetical protein
MSRVMGIEVSARHNPQAVCVLFIGAALSIRVINMADSLFDAIAEVVVLRF